MLAVFTAPDALVIAALVAAMVPALASWRNSHRAAAQTRNNGGTTMRDAIDRIEATLATDVVPRLDRGAQVIAEHADRLAVLEARPKSTRPRKAD